MVRVVRGNLFDADADAWVNTVNTVGVMGKGLAFEFKRRFPENYELYRQACESKTLQVGKMLVFATQQLQPQYIVNFPTKQHWRGKSKLDYIRQGLEDLKQVVRQHNIRSIAMPALGCGQGGLRLEQVLPLIEQAFATMPEVDVQVFVADAPEIAPEEAAMLRLLEAYSVLNPVMTEAELQLLAEILLLQETGARRRAKGALTPHQLAQSLIRKPLIEKSMLGDTPMFWVGTKERYEQARAALETAPDWRARAERLAPLIEECDGLAALQAVYDYLQVNSSPVRRRYFVELWRRQGAASNT